MEKIFRMLGLFFVVMINGSLLAMATRVVPGEMAPFTPRVMVQASVKEVPAVFVPSKKCVIKPIRQLRAVCGDVPVAALGENKSSKLVAQLLLGGKKREHKKDVATKFLLRERPLVPVIEEHVFKEEISTADDEPAIISDDTQYALPSDDEIDSELREIISRPVAFRSVRKI